VSTQPPWQWDEMQQVGTDYADVRQVEAYDRRMGSFREVEAENLAMLDALALPAQSAVLEVGCGTGRFALAAARAGHAVTAVDVSRAMLDYVAAKARDAGLTNVRVQHAGFLTMDVPAGHFDAAVSAAALHHLPDLWKRVALRNVRRALKPAGRFLLRDVVFSLPEGDGGTCFERFIGRLPDAMRREATAHVAREYSTLDWIMEGLLERSGFAILDVRHEAECFVAYDCRCRPTTS